MTAMKTAETKETILTLHLKGVTIREISRILNISRNTVKRVLRGKGNSLSQTSPPLRGDQTHHPGVVQTLPG